MNKAELIESLETRLGGKKAASDALEAVLDVIIREVAKGGKVSITGFGTFEKVARAARTGRNPRTGDVVPIRKTSVPKFKPGTGFKNVVAKPSSLPKTGNASARAAVGTAGAAPVKATAKKSTAKKATSKSGPATKAAAKKSTAKKATSKSAPATKTPAKKVTATKKATPAKKSTAKRTAKR